jgi:diaminopropionate ammonia-lyase
MTKLVSNPYRKSTKAIEIPSEVPFPSVNAEAPALLLKSCPAYIKTPLLALHDLALESGIARLYCKDETQRMGLGSFKALGAAYVIAHEAANSGKEDLSKALQGKAYVTASAGNHGLSVAAGAKIFGANAVIYLSKTVPEAFADRLRFQGAEVRIEGDNYEMSMAAAMNAAKNENMILLSDTSWGEYTEMPQRLMEGYLVSASETVEEIDEVPTHIFLQAGVGGLACAMAAYFRKAWGDEPTIVVVEPTEAPALQASIEAGKSVFADGGVSNMGRLDCKEPSLIALNGLARDTNFFLTVTDLHASSVTNKLGEYDVHSTPSGVGGLAGLLSLEMAGEMGLNADSVALCIISEGAE